MVGNRKKVLFLCTNNSIRSQMAEGILKTYYKDKYESYSAGVQPTQVNPYAVEVMKEIGIDLSDQYSKSINEFQDEKFDYVITVCDNARETCPFFPGDRIIHRGFKDPLIQDGSIEENLDSFKKIRNEIKNWIIEYFGKNKV
jgi:arsenate reductase